MTFFLWSTFIAQTLKKNGWQFLSNLKEDCSSLLVMGKHIRIWCPISSGSEYVDYSGFFTLIVLAFVGPDYRFLYIDVGCQRSASDGGLFSKSSLFQALAEGTLNLPPPQSLPQSSDLLFETIAGRKLEHFLFVMMPFPLGLV